MAEDKITELQSGFNTAFINSAFNSNLAYRPQSIYNDNKNGQKVFSAIEDELLRCDSFAISVAFITRGGITPLLQTLAAMRKGNTCAGAERKHETHCLTGKMICGNCGHRLSHSYSDRSKYYCAKHYLDKADGKCNISVLDATMKKS